MDKVEENNICDRGMICLKPGIVAAMTCNPATKPLSNKTTSVSGLECQNWMSQVRKMHLFFKKFLFLSTQVWPNGRLTQINYQIYYFSEIILFLIFQQYPHNQKMMELYPNSSLGDHNECRNPQNSRMGE